MAHSSPLLRHPIVFVACLTLTACAADAPAGSSDSGSPDAAGSATGDGASGGGLAGRDAASTRAGDDAAIHTGDGAFPIGALDADTSLADGSATGGPVVDAAATDSADSGSAPNLPPFGNVTLHPDRISFYMVPDLEGPYVTNWPAVKASLDKLHTVMPDAWIRWDNETGHNTNDTNQVTTFVDNAQSAGVPLIVTASASPGYNNMWANQYVTKNPSAIASSSIRDIADGGFLDFTSSLMKSHPVVKFIETINEPDGPGWFVTDPDNAADFDYYMSKLYTAMGITAGNKTTAASLLGPAVAFASQGNIWNDWMGRSEVSTVSYHTYGDPPRNGLKDFPGKDVYVTEYGPATISAISPASLLEDLLLSEKDGRLSGSIRKVFYNQIFQNGQNPSAFSEAIESGQPHFALRGWFRALTAWAAVGSISTRAQREDAHPDYVAADDRHGGFAMLLWDNTSATESAQIRTVTNTSTRSGATLNVFIIRFNGNSDLGTGQCVPITGQSTVSATVGANTVSVTVNSLASQDAVLVTTRSCVALAN